MVVEDAMTKENVSLVSKTNMKMIEDAEKADEHETAE